MNQTWGCVAQTLPGTWHPLLCPPVLPPAVSSVPGPGSQRAWNQRQTCISEWCSPYSPLPTPTPLSTTYPNPRGKHKYLKWAYHEDPASNLSWIGRLEHTILFPQKTIWKVDINPNTMLVCLLCSISRKLGKAIELEAIKPTHQVLSVHEKKRKSVSQISLKAEFLSLTWEMKGDRKWC